MCHQPWLCETAMHIGSQDFFHRNQLTLAIFTTKIMPGHISWYLFSYPIHTVQACQVTI